MERHADGLEWHADDLERHADDLEWHADDLEWHADAVGSLLGSVGASLRVFGSWILPIARQNAGGQAHSRTLRTVVEVITEERGSVLECSRPLELSIEALDCLPRIHPPKALHSPQAREQIARQSAGGPAHSRTLRAVVEAIAEERVSVLECSRPLELSIEALDCLPRIHPPKAAPSPQAREHIARQSAGGPAHSRTLRAVVEVITEERGSVLECSRPLELSIEALDCPPRIHFPKAPPSPQACEHIARQSAGGPAHSRTLRAVVEAIADERGSVLECSRPLELSIEALDCLPRIHPPKAPPSPQACEHIARQSAGGPAHSRTLRAVVEAIADERGSVLECSRPLELSVEAPDCLPRIRFPNTLHAPQVIHLFPQLIVG